MKITNQSISSKIAIKLEMKAKTLLSIFNKFKRVKMENPLKILFQVYLDHLLVPKLNQSNLSHLKLNLTLNNQELKYSNKNLRTKMLKFQNSALVKLKIYLYFNFLNNNSIKFLKEWIIQNQKQNQIKMKNSNKWKKDS